MNKKQEKIERENTERRKRRDAETSDAMRRTPRGSEIRKEKKKRGAENSGRMQGMSTKRRKREREEENTIENKRR